MNRLVREILVGLLVGLSIVTPEPARAQWIVHDPTAYVLQTEWRIEEAARWVETIEHYAREIEYQIKQWLTLKDVLTNAEKLVSHNTLWASRIANLGRTIRGIWRLKESIESLVEWRISALRNIYSRLRDGIFDPARDLDDLEQYLRNGIGRHAEIAVNRTLAADRVLQELNQSWQRSCAKLAGLIVEKERLEELIEEEVRSGKCPSCIEDLKAQHSSVEEQILVVEKEIDELWRKMTERAAMHHVRLRAGKDFAREIIAREAAWARFIEVKDEAITRIDRWAAEAERNRPAEAEPPRDLGPVLQHSPHDQP